MCYQWRLLLWHWKFDSESCPFLRIGRHLVSPKIEWNAIFHDLTAQFNIIFEAYWQFFIVLSSKTLQPFFIIILPVCFSVPLYSFAKDFMLGCADFIKNGTHEWQQWLFGLVFSTTELLKINQQKALQTMRRHSAMGRGPGNANTLTWFSCTITAIDV